MRAADRACLRPRASACPARLRPCVLGSHAPRHLTRWAYAYGLIAVAVTALAFAAAPASAQPVCGQTITQDTTLTADLDCGDDPVVIGASGITLDLGGNNASGNGNPLQCLNVVCG